jgi:actin-like ATPase involved in cell morphogenesis
MSYRLGIDFGTTSVVAAVHRAGDVAVVPLGGSGAAAVPAALHLARDGGVSIGDRALRLAGIDPGRVVRALARRVGDPTPLTVGRESWTPEDLSACLLTQVVARVAEQEGGRAAAVALAHPTTWAADTLDRLGAALDRKDVDVTFVPAPVAAAAAYGSAEPVAVFDLGGGRFEAAVVGRGGTVLGRPEGLDVGGLDFDELVLAHVLAGLPDDVTADARLRRACLRAKEVLSSKAETVVRVRRDDLRAEVRLDRATFEGLVGPHVARMVSALRRTTASAELEAGRPAEVLLVGGSTRIPLIARAVEAELDRPVRTVDDVETLVARGAVLAALTAEAGAVSADPGTEAPTVTLRLRGADLTAPYGTPAVTAEEPREVEAGEVEAGEVEAGEVEPGEAETAEIEVPAAELPAPGLSAPDAPVMEPDAEAVVPASRPAAGRAVAVLDPGSRRSRRPRSLSRILLGAGAIVVAALVLVALFRPDGPLDPPSEPGAVAGVPRVAGAPAVPPPAVVAPLPGVEGVRAEDVAEVRPTAAPRRGSDARSVDLPGARSGVATTPPVTTGPRATTVPRPAGSTAGPRAAAPPVGAAPRTPPTPVDPTF